MSRPVILKLGGSVLTDKGGEGKVRRNDLRRIITEVSKAGVPMVLVHGAGSHGHPQALAHGIGQRKATPEGVAQTLAAVLELHAQVVEVAARAGLKPVSVPLHLSCTSEGDDILGFPVERLRAFVDEGYTPVLHGTLVRDADLGWRVVSGDEIMATLAPELDPRLAVFVSDVDGILDGAGRVRPTAHPDTLVGVVDDATGGMQGKLAWAGAIADVCPVWIVNGLAKGRVSDVLKGKRVVGTRVEATA